MIISDLQKTWLVFVDDKLVGALTCIIKNKNEAELTGFYVYPSYQGKGIGKNLYSLALKFSCNRDLVLDIYAHNTNSIEMYNKWGWMLDESRGDNGYFIRHWPEWPKDLEVRCIYMKLKKNKLQQI
ncbi:MAG: GCN5-related N-acetyltransferase [Candidatus Falkowbacteria bacterium GW2011_GWC2_38_22]|uniref:GCN5-related N-acetyltransferase n=1 Tax=Candidatus Falkowbacteria bacterium GW2011_GWE1_38_31 TaxID=1618638 RepID=A0A0G0JQ79_9BACT|nr:MAG: GCN5-related N-acetyltransferase [Candidatus Falkowbacteria bacterium GW2011_GWF2_38_1205]KKQ60770.1 MAG: GCN5-related N-acetyltransferase [Candidatus Falkowbacteria bacterium GW2011_GWC2_38_22]KKQ62937.1 MAG: GCN5-related N-acetyltransferase [Candidatus Falkowbacteria bacterium GW2011_GWF1_38_22]KKQ64949.1 MAG: GCN5-related N-acetyltransferase [Candidatus Falkowbacteria bacterium GW2011_GWE2_38_254]KKQ69713.1 MAG: GCN5-related N-acetyltransferase [Candidatus Falkowbacteria bacterium GW